MSTKSSGPYRALEILLGIVALAVGVLALIFPAGIVVTVLVLFGIALFVIGVLRMATAYSSHLPKSARATNVVIGALAIIVGLIIWIFPTFALVSFAVLLGIGLLIYGVGRIVVGSAATNLSNGLRGIIIFFGIMVAAFAVLVIIFPVIGVLTYAFFVSISFILIGIDSLVSGISNVQLT